MFGELRLKRRCGFTLTELLLVVTILAILAAIALPRYFPQSEKARISEAISILSAIRQGEMAYFLEHGDYLDDPATSGLWGTLGIDDPGSGGFFTYNVSAPGGGTFTATATRTSLNVPGGTSYAGKIITIDETGAWGPSDSSICHPLGPSTANGC